MSDHQEKDGIQGLPGNLFFFFYPYHGCNSIQTLSLEYDFYRSNVTLNDKTKIYPEIVMIYIFLRIKPEW